MIQGCVGKFSEFKRIFAVGTSIHCVSVYDIFLNTTLNFLSDITCRGWYFIVENRILIHVNKSRIFCMQKDRFRGGGDVASMIYPP